MTLPASVGAGGSLSEAADLALRRQLAIAMFTRCVQALSFEPAAIKRVALLDAAALAYARPELVFACACGRVFVSMSCRVCVLRHGRPAMWGSFEDTLDVPTAKSGNLQRILTPAYQG